MVKMKGFTLIEIMIVVAVVAILLTLVMGFFVNDDVSDTDNIVEGLDAEVTYISRDKRLSEIMTLKRHDDGNLWGCVNDTGNCYMVEE